MKKVVREEPYRRGTDNRELLLRVNLLVKNISLNSILKMISEIDLFILHRSLFEFILLFIASFTFLVYIFFLFLRDLLLLRKGMNSGSFFQDPVDSC